MTTNNVSNNYSISTPTSWLFITKDLTSSNILNLTTTPISIVASPGANKMIVVKSFAFILFFNSVAYAAGGNLGLLYTTSNTLAGSLITGGAVTASASSFTQIESKTSPISDLSNFANNGISVKNASSAFTTGNSTGRILLWYTIVDTV